MPQFGGKNAKKTKKTSSSSKRHFTVVIDRGVRRELTFPPKSMDSMFLQPHLLLLKKQ